nr:sugar transferase [Sphingomonas jinjuensis]
MRQSTISPSARSPQRRRAQRVAPSLWVRRAPKTVDLAAGRALDVIVALTLLVVVAPVMVALALVIWCQDRGSPFFVHHRIGRGGQTFPCYKFRTMVTDSNERLRALLERDPEAAEEWRRDHKLRRDPRITTIGRFLRKSSLDELPQLLNVVLGHMSLVGPRPIIESEVIRYGRFFSDYCSVRPGITGLWQISGRNDTSYRRRVVLDMVYSRTKSIPTDIFVLTRTVPAVLSARGSS